MPRGWRWFLAKFVVGITSTYPSPLRQQQHSVFQSSSTHTHSYTSSKSRLTRTHTEMGTNLFSSQLARKGLIVCQSAKVAHTHTRLPKYPSIYRFCITCTCAPSLAGTPNEPSANDQSSAHLPFLSPTSCASATFTLYFNAFRLRSYMFTCLFWLPSVLAAGVLELIRGWGDPQATTSRSQRNGGEGRGNDNNRKRNKNFSCQANIKSRTWCDLTSPTLDYLNVN